MPPMGRGVRFFVLSLLYMKEIQKSINRLITPPLTSRPILDLSQNEPYQKLIKDTLKDFIADLEKTFKGLIQATERKILNIPLRTAITKVKDIPPDLLPTYYRYLKETYLPHRLDVTERGILLLKGDLTRFVRLYASTPFESELAYLVKDVLSGLYSHDDSALLFDELLPILRYEKAKGEITGEFDMEGEKDRLLRSNPLNAPKGMPTGVLVGFNRATLLHWQRNPHHLSHHHLSRSCGKLTPLPIAPRFAVEMMADHLSHHQSREKFVAYINKNYEKFVLNKHSRRAIYALVESIGISQNKDIWHL